MSDLKQLISNNKIRRFRRQSGSVIERSGGFFLRYNSEGKKITVKLCDRDKRHHSVDCIPVQLLRDTKMAEVNAGTHAAVASSTVMVDQTIGEFWVTTYLPWMTKKQLRASTRRGYENIWEQYLEPLKTRPLAQYSTLDASEFLTGLASRRDSDGKDTSLNRNSLAHVRSLMSGMFKVALNTRGPNGEALRTSNPMRDVVVDAKVRAPKKAVAYTIPEIVAIIKGVERVDAKLFFALCSVLALRPSEAAAVRWENVSDDMVKVREAAPYGIVGALKTEQSQRDLQLVEPVKTLMQTWRKECGSPSKGLIFTNEAGKAINHNDYAKKYITPGARKACGRWHGCYSGRHGGATALFDLTGDARAANQTLGNSLPVVMASYIKPSSAAGSAGLKLFEAALQTEMKK
jgi:integrase